MFGFCQVAIDIEPLVRMIRGDIVIHGFTHTYLGATLIALFSVVVGRPVCQALLNHWTPDPRSSFETWLRGAKRISRPAAIAGAFVGAYSHVFLDSLMHSDMQPYAPVSQANGLLHLVSVDALHVVCVLSGVLGAVVMFSLFLVRRGARVDGRA